MEASSSSSQTPLAGPSAPGAAGAPPAPNPLPTVTLEPGDPFDLDNYISNYTGRTKLFRLLFIGHVCPQLRREAVLKLLPLIKSMTSDTGMYAQAVRLGNSLTPDDGGDSAGGEAITLDDEWVRATDAKNRSELEKLDVELKNYQNNLIKESIRMAHRDLGDFYRSTGDYNNALKSYTRTRDFCTTSEHVLEMCFNVVEVCLEMQNYITISTYISKAEAVVDSFVSSGGSTSKGLSDSGNGSLAASKTAGGAGGSGPDAISALFRAGGGGDTGEGPRQERRGGRSAAVAAAAAQKEGREMQARLEVVAGITNLALGKYAQAARLFLKTSPEYAGAYSSIIAPSDVALYAVLCALATLDRDEVKLLLLDNVTFRGFLETEPHARELLDTFWESKYDRALDVLRRHKSRHLLDRYLSPMHISYLTTLITHRALQQFVTPFSAVSIDRVASAFGWDRQRAAMEVVGVVERGEVKAKVDFENWTLNATQTDHRIALFRQALEAGREKTESTKKVLWRLKLLQAGLVVKGHNGL